MATPAADGHADEYDDYESIPGSSLSTNLLAGAVAGVTEHVVTFPIDAIKTRMQIIGTGGPSLSPSVSAALARISSTEGWSALWRGASSVVLGAGPSHALYFSVYEYFKGIFRSWDPSEHQHIAHAAAGGLAIISHDAFATPFDVVKQRMQASSRSHTGLFTTASQIFRSEGLSAFYVSLPTTLIMSVPYQAIQFATYEYMRKSLNPLGQYDPKSHIIAGAAAGTIASIVTNPLDVAKTVLQTRGLATESTIRHVSGLASAFRAIYKLDGIYGFARGVKARVIANAPSTAICWTTYEFLKMALSSSASASSKLDSSPTTSSSPSSSSSSSSSAFISTAISPISSFAPKTAANAATTTTTNNCHQHSARQTS